ncbi:olfactory receptor 2D3-like [Leptodactylus fuscus]|uniref:olfactory receptor 2D3-like n=1 Tax=Leptodactylus fuscus TaxID=238119 RepID=UPI003F4E751A
MENYTSIDDFHLLPYFLHSKDKSIIFLALLLTYIFGLVWNCLIIIVIYMDPRLHVPLYLFLSNLSLVDICYIMVTIPKLLHMLVTRNISVSRSLCLTQLGFFILVASTEIALLTSMAFDRYVAICKPLHYHCIMNRRRCLLILVLSWVSAAVNATLITSITSITPWSSLRTIHHFFCDLKALAKISSNGLGFQLVLYIESLIIGVLAFAIILMSYVKIFKIVLLITFSDGQRKAFSTCSSHLMVLFMFYGVGVCVYIRPLTQNTEELDQIFSLFYILVTPTLNPLIYSLSNKEVHGALLKIMTRCTRKSSVAF